MALLSLGLTGCNQVKEATPNIPVRQADAELPIEDKPAPSSDTLAFVVVEKPNLWSRLRTDFNLSNVTLDRDSEARVEKQLKALLKNPRHIPHISSRAEPFLHLIMEEVTERQMPMEMALLPGVESAFKPFAYSSGKAAGLWQFIPSTGRLFGLKQNWWYDGRRDVLAATPAALDYLQQLSKQFDGDWLLALAAYNAGGGTVRRAIRKNKRADKPTDYWHLQLPKETMDYVPRLLALSRLIADPVKYNTSLHPISDEPKLVPVNIGSQIDLSRAALLAEMELEHLHSLNPGFNRWATDPDGPHHLLIPQQQVLLFQGNLEKLPANARVEWKRHIIRKGDSLGVLARRFHTTISTLKQLNNLSSNTLHVGKALMVPVASAPLDNKALNYVQNRIIKSNPALALHKTVHKVKNGDTLWKLGRKYGVSPSKLAAWNNISQQSTLKIGQRLLVRKASTGSVLLKTSTRTELTRKIRYTVRQGDSLYKIAKHYKVSIENLRNWNQGKIGKYLKPGQKIVVHVDLTHA